MGRLLGVIILIVGLAIVYFSIGDKFDFWPYGTDIWSISIGVIIAIIGLYLVFKRPKYPI